MTDHSKNFSWYQREWCHWLIAAGLAGMAVLWADWQQLAIADALSFVAIGALAGYLTNEIAITLLTWPTKPRLFGRFLGLLYRRREAFGQTLVDNAVQRFLNPDFFASLTTDKKVQQVIRETSLLRPKRHMGSRLVPLATSCSETFPIQASGASSRRYS